MQPHPPQTPSTPGARLAFRLRILRNLGQKFGSYYLLQSSKEVPSIEVYPHQLPAARAGKENGFGKPPAQNSNEEYRMNLNLSGHHLAITPAIREYVIGKLERINRHFEQVIDVSVILSVEKLEQKCEATVHISGKDIFVETIDADMYAAIDGLVDKLDRQIIKHKEKWHINPHHSSSIKRIPQ